MVTLHRVAMSVADAHFRQLNAGGLRLPVSGLLILFADVHRKFNSMMSATSVATKRHVAIMHAEREIINHVQFRLIFTSLCDELKLVAPPEIKMQCAIDFTYEHVMRKWLHVREKEYLRAANQYCVATIAFRAVLAAAAQGIPRRNDRHATVSTDNMEPLIPTVPILLPVAVPLDNDAGTDTSTDR